jgi:hypothetical protein
MFKKTLSAFFAGIVLALASMSTVAATTDKKDADKPATKPAEIKKNLQKPAAPPTESAKAKNAQQPLALPAGPAKAKNAKEKKKAVKGKKSGVPDDSI